MRFVTYLFGGRPIAGVVSEGRVYPLSSLGELPEDLVSLIAAGESALALVRAALSGGHLQNGAPLEDVQLLAPIPRPPKNIICLGLNYAAHAEESARATGDSAGHGLPQHPVVFTKAPTTINGPTSPIPYDPAVSTQIDWEVELAVIIGRRGRVIAEEDALDYVFGYTVLNDVTARDLQQQHRQFFLGKSLDGSCPMGPWIVTADEIPDPQQLRLTSHVNNVLKQEGHTSEQIFSVARTISILSRGMTLEPGDIITTGTPPGVGFARTPPEWLRPGDEVVCAVEGIGELRNRVESQRAGL
jgi:2-keto-4-pentenoate hydratase/2-oxohepta-3-ene-1,7-dioic acid hydratase in catechol pathway